ncbi:class I SAM-dependent methyltransferase [Breoghania sp.]|uniref:class I SAM-dependent methyltransferase n=1 Tax=Breoghania sp. TaxID=2065378 RepID=UPI0026042610|nr:class I SAM-dependent methyltransferase [Breoghania sp.]MDJ0930061.1 class I SAM-dependent methyltransferase [Breoghania sp.]
MTGFSADWLTLREPADERARAPEIRAAVISALSNAQAPLVVDFACGTGSTVRALCSLLPAGQRWQLVDHDAALLTRARAECTGLGGIAELETIKVDLAAGPFPLLDRVDLVTTSAFLDLLSEDWLVGLIDALAERRLPFYAALTYDGRVTCSPQHALDDEVTDLVNRHQHGEKGFGPALGPNAAAHAIERLEKAGFKVVQARSDWTCREDEPIFQRELVEGWANAAAEIGGLSAEDLQAWTRFRLEEIDAGRSQIQVGHIDIFALPTDVPN